jgi:LSU ribosomal protein L29P
VRVKEIRDLDIDELRQREKKLREELFRLHFRNATGQLNSPAKVRSVRKDISRVKTVAREKETQG